MVTKEDFLERYENLRLSLRNSVRESNLAYLVYITGYNEGLEEAATRMTSNLNNYSHVIRNLKVVNYE